MLDLEKRDNQIYRVVFETNPISNDVRKAGFGGVNRYENLEGYSNSDLVISTTKRIDILSSKWYYSLSRLMRFRN